MTGSSGDTFVTTVGTNGATSLVTTDAAAAAAHLTITADGTVDIDSAGVLTLDSGAAINIEPAAGSAILLDGTISVDAGVVTGATSVTSTAFVGDITGDVTGTADVATVATTVTITDNESTNESNALIFTAGGDVDGGNIGLESDGTLTYNPSTGKVTATGFVGTLTGAVTGNVAGNLTGTVATATQNSITTATGLVSVGALDSGSITSGFGAIDNGTSNIRSATITAETAFVPDAADGATLGTSSLEFSDLYLADGGTIQFGNDQDVTLTHVADTGLTLKHTATADDKPIVLTLATGETDIAADDILGSIRFQAPDEGTGTDAILVAAAIDAVSEGDFSSSNNATKLEFRTGASETATTKLTISSAGHMTQGTAAVGSDGRKYTFGGNIATFRSGTSDAYHLTFSNANGQVGIIRTVDSSTAYNTSSDYRLKENVDYTWDATTRLKQLKPARFNFIADADKTVDGFIAHEVSSVVPEAVTGEKDATETILF